MTPEQIAEVSITVSAPIDAQEVGDLNEAERLALVVGAAYGNALADRDEARQTVQSLSAALTALASAAEDVLALEVLGSLTFAHDERTADHLRGVVSVSRDLVSALESVQAPETQEGGTHAAHQ